MPHGRQYEEIHGPQFPTVHTAHCTHAEILRFVFDKSPTRVIKVESSEDFKLDPKRAECDEDGSSGTARWSLEAI